MDEEVGIKVLLPTDQPYAVVDMLFNGVRYSAPTVTTWLHRCFVVQEAGKLIKIATCQWPKDESKLNTYLEKRTPPGEDWTSVSVKILKFCKSLAVAKHLSKVAEEKSDLSESDAQDKETSKAYRRIMNAPLDETHRLSKRPKLPDSNVMNPINVESSDCPKMDSTQCAESLTAPVDAVISISEAASGDSVLDKQSESVSTERSGQPETESLEMTVADLGVTPSRTPTKTNGPLRKLSYSVSPRKKLLSPSKSAEGLVSHRTFMREVNSLKHRLDNLKIMAGKIYLACCPRLETASEDRPDLPAIPVHSDRDMEKLTEFLHDSDNKIQVIRLFVDYGRESLKESVKGMMPKLMTNKYASSYNMDGINKASAEIKKKAFKGTLLHSVVLAALKKYGEDVEKNSGRNYGFNIDGANSYIGNWLKNAPRRFENEIKKKKSAGNAEENI